MIGLGISTLNGWQFIMYWRSCDTTVSILRAKKSVCEFDTSENLILVR